MILLIKMKSGKQDYQMRTKGLIESLAGTKKMVVEEIFFEAETNAIVIKARPAKREQHRCAICQRRSKFYDSGRGVRRWRCSDVGSTMVYIEASATATARLTATPIISE